MKVWFCTECGAKHTSGNYCGECGAPRYGYQPQNTAATQSDNGGSTPDAQPGAFDITRSSVSAGDDCHAPHTSSISFTDQDTVLDLLGKVTDYVPLMHQASWNILCGFDTIGVLVSGEDGPYRCIAKEPDRLAADLPPLELFCLYNVENTVMKPSDFVSTGVLAYGVNIGRFDFSREGIYVYAISDLPHIGPSDCFTLYQISHEDYLRLLRQSLSGNIPDPPLTKEVTDAVRQGFLCGESIYQARNEFTLADVDLSLAELI